MDNMIGIIFKRLIICALILLIIFSNKVYCQTLSAEQIYNKLKDAVVVVLAYDYNNNLSTQGSGVVINDKGFIVTNYHILSGNDRLEIMHGDEIIPFMDIIGIDVEKDILILKIEENKFPSVKIGDVKSLRVGQKIYAIGSPMGFENTISEGIISGLRSYDELNKNYVQITASISPGSSGGAVVNEKGELIGISTLTVKEGQNLNFAIPIDEILRVEIGSYGKMEVFKDFKLFDKGFASAKAGDFTNAIKYYTQFIQIYPNDAAAYNNRGEARSNLEDYIGAIEDYDKVIEINPNEATAYNNRAVAKYNLGDNGGAIRDYNQAIEINEDYSIAYYNRGIVKGILGDFSGEIQDYTKAIELDPYNSVFYYNRGIAKSNSEDYKSAIRDFNKTIELNPINVGAFNRRGIAKCKLEDYRGAIEDYNKAIGLLPNYAVSYYNRGDAKGYLKDYEGALQDYTEAILINPDYVGAYQMRGVIKHILGDEAGACLDWSKAGELGYDGAYDLIREYCN